MTTTEHLDGIVAKCRELLEIAERRQIGKWIYERNEWIHSDSSQPSAIALPQCSGTAQYIAACAGPAESGWRATIAAIESMQSRGELVANDEELCDSIVAAWPEGLL